MATATTTKPKSPIQVTQVPRHSQPQTRYRPYATYQSPTLKLKNNSNALPTISHLTMTSKSSFIKDMETLETRVHMQHASVANLFIDKNTLLISDDNDDDEELIIHESTTDDDDNDDDSDSDSDIEPSENPTIVSNNTIIHVDGVDESKEDGNGNKVKKKKTEDQFDIMSAVDIIKETHRENQSINIGNALVSLKTPKDNKLQSFASDDDNKLEDEDDDDSSESTSEISLEEQYYLRPQKNDEPSLTMDLDATTEYWNKTEIKLDTFEYCGVRFEDDDWDGKKPPASQFRSNQFFFQFILERLHNRSQLILDTVLPEYKSWKDMRKVSWRNHNLKSVDHALKDCNDSVYLLKLIVKNSFILFYDKNQIKNYNYNDIRYQNEIPSKVFNIGCYSILEAQDLFDTAPSTPKLVDWNIAIGLDTNDPGNNGLSPGLHMLQSVTPDNISLDSKKKIVQLQMEKYCALKKFQKYCLSQYINENLINKNNLKFIDLFGWKKIKSEILNSKKLSKDQQEIFNGFDSHVYYLNPSIDNLANIMINIHNISSNNKIICEPIVWLIYVYCCLLDRQEKLQNLILNAIAYSGGLQNNNNNNINQQNNDNNNNNQQNNDGKKIDKNKVTKGQKLEVLISNLAKQAKDESERLRGIMARLPSVDDLRKTIEIELLARDKENKLNYTKSFEQQNLKLSKKHITSTAKYSKKKK